MEFDELKNTIEKIVPDAELKEKVRRKILSGKPVAGRSKKIKYLITAVAACLVLVCSVFIFSRLNDRTIVVPYSEISVYKTSDMLGFIIYQKRVYEQSGDRIFYEDIDEVSYLIGEKLGKAGLNEFVDDYGHPAIFIRDDIQYSDFTSNYTDSDVYTVQGYDKKRFLLTFGTFYGDDKNTDYVEIWRSLDGMSISSFADVLNLFHLDRQFEGIQYSIYDTQTHSYGENFSYSGGEEKKILRLLKKVKPLSMQKSGLPEQEYKMLVLKLKNGMEMELQLGQDGTMVYQFIVFQLEEKDLQWLWNELE